MGLYKKSFNGTDLRVRGLWYFNLNYLFSGSIKNKNFKLKHYYKKFVKVAEKVESELSN